MAKDGTARGGARIGGGRKSKALTEKLAAGNPGGRKLTVVDFDSVSPLEGNDMPPPKEYMMERQRSGGDLGAAEIYKETWLWLKERGCEKIVNSQMIEQYAMSVSRWIQCERAISEYGYLSKHPTTGNACASPYVTMSQQYVKQINQIWYQIFQVVKENCSVEWDGAKPQEDPMERLLKFRKG